MQFVSFLILLFILPLNRLATQNSSRDIFVPINKDDLIKHIEYIASDALMGRNTGEPGNQMAAGYIAGQFEKSGVQKLKNAMGYYQELPLALISAGAGSLTISGQTFEQGKELIFIEGHPVDLDTEAVFLGFGEKPELYENKSLKDKVVIVWLGSEEIRNPVQAFRLSEKKLQYAREAGALALIEMYNLQMPWVSLRNYFRGKQLELVDRDKKEIPFIVFNAETPEMITTLKNAIDLPVRIRFDGMVKEQVEAVNVIGMIPGSDEMLKNEYVLLSAHFDHVGVKKGVPAGQDSIYNGTRDNAIGTGALIAAAEYFAKHPPKRSILLAAWNGEEKGLLGSRYFADNPLVPLDKIIFNLNIDNGGYNDTTAISIIGYKRTGAAEIFEKAASPYGFKVHQDPAPGQNLFDRSDNVSFAAKGIPAPSFSMGFTDFDAEIFKYYHQLGDHTETVNFDYVYKYIKSYLLAAKLIADQPIPPKWESGDKYEQAARELYGDKY